MLPFAAPLEAFESWFMAVALLFCPAEVDSATGAVESSPASEFSFPCGFYQGVEIFIHPSCLNTPPRLFVEGGIDLAAVVIVSTVVIAIAIAVAVVATAC